jgi:predicted nuclease with TOPRIM domain
MKKRGRLYALLLMIGIFNCMVLPVVNAETFDIGTKVAESDPDSGGNRWYYFDSGCMIGTKPDYIDYVPLIFDGNETTGIDHNFSLGHDRMTIHLVFPNSYYVNNITFKPVFNGNASEYRGSQLIYIGGVEFWIPLPFSEEKTIHINGTINTIRLRLDSNGTNHFYFNDVIIDYNLSPSNLDEIQDQINNLTQQLYLIDNRINELNNSINELNLTQIQLIENVSNLLISYDQLNSSFINLNSELENLDNRIFNLEAENAVLEQNIENLTLEIENLTSDLEHFENRVFQLESENLTLEITNLDNRIQQLEIENTVLYNKIENLTAEIEELKDDDDEPDDIVVYGAFLLGIFGVLIAFTAIILISKKLGSQELTPKKEESNDLNDTEENDDLG